MQMLISHIEHLLTGNDCVIVPGLGGFVVQHRSALFQEDKILPPHREIYFNQALTHDDGLLISSISQFRSVDYNTARRQVVDDVQMLMQQLSVNPQVSFGQVGVFYLDAGRTLIFEPRNSALSRFVSFGYSELTLRPLAELKSREAANDVIDKDPDTIYIRFSKTKLKRISAVAAALMGLWLISIPVIDNKLSLGSLGFTDNEEVIRISPTPHVKIKHDTVYLSVPKNEPVKQDTAVTAETVDTVAAGAEKYFVVLGAFDSQKRAEDQKNQFIASGIAGVKVMKMGSKVRTYLKGFENKQDALNYLNSICDDREEFRQAWLYCMER